MAGVSCVIGVDGGNTKTIAAVVEQTGRVIGVGHGRCTDIYGSSSPESACAELDRTIRQALDAAGCRSGDLSAGMFSLAGADWPEDYAYLRSHLTTSFSFGFAPVVANDSIGGLRLGGPHWEGIAILCGTGNAVGARRRDGAYFHLGFWPDTVGAVSLSESALDAVYRDHLGLGPPTSLTARALALFEADDAVDLLHRFTRRGGLGRSELVRMSPVLLDEADSGDRVAAGIVGKAGRALGRQGRISAQQIDLDPRAATVVMAGGLFRHPTKALENAVMAELPGATASRTAKPPVLGAVMAAMDMIGHSCDPEALHRSLAAFKASPA